MFEYLAKAAHDPILSLMTQFHADPRAKKIDLGIGIYKNSEGNTPVMQAVTCAQERIFSSQKTKSYVGLAGNEAFNRAMLKLVLGESEALSRAQAVQTTGGSGALRLLAELIALAHKNKRKAARVWLPDPSYINHQPVMQAAGIETCFYSYFAPNTKQLDENALFETLATVEAGDIVLLHACCHNPTGVDLSLQQWQKIAQLAKSRGFIPFIDIAYQGLGDSLAMDRQSIAILASHCEQLLIACSCSKNFGLYRERTGAAILIGRDAEQALQAKNTLLQLARLNYSMPPDHGAAIVATILNDPALETLWQDELAAMQARIITLREQLAAALHARTQDHRFAFLTQHKGMFSMLGLSPQQVARLREEFAIYMVEDSRINIAGLAERDLERVADALIAVTTN
ncbi:MAG: aromatic amino acid transaminase [Vibrionaceae bacterium]